MLLDHPHRFASVVHRATAMPGGSWSLQFHQGISYSLQVNTRLRFDVVAPNLFIRLALDPHRFLRLLSVLCVSFTSASEHSSAKTLATGVDSSPLASPSTSPVRVVSPLSLFLFPNPTPVPDTLAPLPFFFSTSLSSLKLLLLSFPFSFPFPLLSLEPLDLPFFPLPPPPTSA